MFSGRKQGTEGNYGLRAIAAALCAMTVLFSSFYALAPNTASEPTVVVNPNNTQSLVWTFDNQADFAITDATVGGGFGTLRHKNESLVENTQASYDLGVRKENISTSQVPNSIVLDRYAAQVQTVVMQPGPEANDTYIDEGGKNNNYGDSNEIRLDSETSRQLRPLCRFDLSPVPSNAIVHNATLWLYLKGGKNVPLNFAVHVLNYSFVEMEVTWNRYAIGQAWTAGGEYDPLCFSKGTIPSNVEGWYSIDLSRLVELWVRGSVPNNGIIIVPQAMAGDNVRQFVSSDDANRADQWPMLAVNYTLPGVTGAYESRALGPGTNSLFTLANWTLGNTSLASDEFSGTALSPQWRWHYDPSEGSGAYDVGTNRSGWLHMMGQTSNELKDDPLGANFLYQNITGDFSAATSVEAFFANSQMSAGLLAFNDATSWAGIFLSGTGGSTLVTVMACEGGASSNPVSFSEPTATKAWFSLDKIAGSIVLNFSMDGTSWTNAYNYTPTFAFKDMVSVGLMVSPGTANANTVADFDYVRILPIGVLMSVETRARIGDSALLTDPSWEPWSAPLPSSSGSVIGQTGKYIQYQVLCYSSVDWASATFSWFSCHFERYASSGIIQTENYLVMDFSTWYTLTTKDVSPGPGITYTNYSYSTDGGLSWSRPSSGGSIGISSTEPNMMVRICLHTNDTLVTPMIDWINATYSAALSCFYLVTPPTITAGDLFTVRIYAKDDANNTMTMWTGPIALHAMDATGLGDASDELAVTTTAITGGGYVTVVDQQYLTAETIRIRASSGAISGLSAQITVVPGDIASIMISPNRTWMQEYSTQVFTATAYDAYGNVVPNAGFSWTADTALGSINTTLGDVVRLTVEEEGVGGYLNVTAGGVSASLCITVEPVRFPPEIAGPMPVQTKPEDFGEWTLDISDFVSDAEDPDSALRWYVTNENIVSVGDENRTGDMTILFATIENEYGADILNLTVVDSDGERDSIPLEVYIQPVNDPPTIDQIDPLVVHYDVPYVYDFTYYVHDVDNTYDQLVLSVDSENDEYVWIDGLRIAFTYPESMMGTNRTVIVTVRDQEPLSSATAVVIRISDDYPPQQSIALPSLVLYQGTTLADCVYLPKYFMDPDGEILYYAYGYVHVTIDIKLNHSINVTAPNDWWGVEYVIFQAIDPRGARAEGAMQITVLPVNHPPVIANVPDLTVRFDERYDFDMKPYVSDPDDSIEALSLSVDDMHCSFTGSTLSILYPASMNNTMNRVNITVNDGEYSDWWAINITVSDDYPPQLVPGLVLPDHSFLEDVEVWYPINYGLEHFFWDIEEGYSLEFYALSSSADVSVVAEPNETGVWKVVFDTTPNYYGISDLTIRAIDKAGAIVERTVNLEVIPVPDAPLLTLPARYEVTEGEQAIMNLAEYIADPDSFLAKGDFEFGVQIQWAAGNDQDYLNGISVVPGMLVFRYPKEFINSHAHNFTIEVRITDQDGKAATDTMEIVLLRAPKIGQNELWLWVAVVATIGGASGMGAIAWVRRKKPFVIRDLMLIHNDGFLMGRYVTQLAGEIDEDILSGMLTAVLNFVEDSMATSADSLKSFGFKEYQAMVKRGPKTFAAVVYEGDVPKDIDGPLAELIGTVERVYKKKIASWTGDIETDFAGLEVLIQSFVKEHSKKAKKGSKAKRTWVAKSGGNSGPAQPMTK